MFRSLRNRLILSHILPALIIIPLMGAAMAYVLETRLLLPMIYRNLTKDATLMAEITRNQPVFWQNNTAAQSLVDGVDSYLSGRVSFVALNGKILATSDETDSAQIIELPNMANVSQGEVVLLQQGTLAEVFAPVFDLNGRLIGVIRMTTRVVTVSDEVYQLRYLLGAVLALGVLAGVLLGSYLAFSINRPIQRVAHSIQSITDGNWDTHVAAQGTDEMRALAETVNMLVDRLNDLEKSRRQLLANLVHELGRPLGAIRSAIQALLKGADKDPQLAGDLLNGLDGETARLQRLLNDLAGLHEQILGRLELNREQIQLDRWLPSALAPWEVSARDKGIHWRAEIPAQLPVITMDADRMAQAIGNLLSNAIKFTPAGGTIAVSAQSSGDEFILEVTDTGAGIPMDEQQKIFQPFYRGAHGRKIVQGMGLGLSIANDIVTAHGGRIELHSEAGKGSHFILRTPKS